MLQYTNYILLDAARMIYKMDAAKQMNTEFDSLYRGGEEEALSAVAPYLFRFVPGTPFANWFMDNGWGISWGVLIKSAWPMPELHKHFRKFIIIKSEEGRDLYFRFYDPRVLRAYLPTLNAAQLTAFFGPVDYFIMEEEDPAFAVRFWLENAKLCSQRLNKQELINKMPPVETAAIPVVAVNKNQEESTKQSTTSPQPGAQPKPGKPKWDMCDL